MERDGLGVRVYAYAFVYAFVAVWASYIIIGMKTDLLVIGE